MATGAKPVRFGKFRLDPGLRLLTDARGEVRLGSRSMDVLLALVARAGTLISHRELTAIVWPGTQVDESALRVHVSALRRALGDGQGTTRHIVNEHGRGYRFVAAPRPADDALPPPVQGDIPAQLVRVIGRGDEIAAIADAFQRHRMVTLVGPGGIGKSTVSLAAAHGMAARFPGGSPFVDLALVEDEGRVVSHIATSMGGAPDRPFPARSIPALLPAAPVLLLIDNCEHVLGSLAPFVDALLAAAPQLRILATSREPTRAQDERILRLEGMPAPQGETTPTAEAAARYPAVELFTERAAALAGFALSDDNARAVAALCRRLDGIPLAIEFAAGWIGLIPVEEIAAGLDSRLLSLGGGRRTALPRHQTLHAVLEWSYRTLSAAEKEALCLLSVFRGSFDLAAAQAVAGDTWAPPALADIMAHLAEKSLLTLDSTAQPTRFRLLETTRSFAAGLLADRPDRHQVFGRHARSCIAQLQGADQEQLHLNRQDWARKYAPLLADVRAAFAWCFSDQGNASTGIDLAMVSCQLGMQSVMAEDFRRYVVTAIEHLPQVPDGSRRDWRLRFFHALMDFDKSDNAAGSQAALSRAMAALPDAEEPPEGLAAGFGAAFTSGDYPAARDFGERVQALGLRRDQPELIFAGKRMLSQALHHLGGHAEARVMSEAVLACPFQFLPLTNTSHMISMRINLARIAWIEGHGARALALMAEAGAMAADSPPTAQCQALTHAEIPLRIWTGDLEGAREALDRLRRISWQHGLQFWIDWSDSLDLAVEVLGPGGARRAERTDFALSLRRVPVKTADFLATFQPALLTGQTAQRVAAGTVLWCAPEVLRAQALATEDRALRHRLLLKAQRLALAQGAAAWADRAARSLAAMGEGPGAHEVIKGQAFSPIN